jgi:hypothetical protein
VALSSKGQQHARASGWQLQRAETEALRPVTCIGLVCTLRGYSTSTIRGDNFAFLWELVFVSRAQTYSSAKAAQRLVISNTPT